MKFIPSIGSIIGASSAALLFFTLFVFLICFWHASNSPSLPIINNLITQATGTNQSQFGAFGLALLEAKMWVSAANFGMQPLIPIELPATGFYYLAVIFAGFFAGIISLRKESRIIDSLIAPALSSIYIVIELAIIGIAASSIAAAFQNLPIPLDVAISGETYVVIFFMTYALFAAGMFSAAGLKELIHYAFREPAKPAAAKVESVEPKKPVRLLRKQKKR